jgi:uncharacterized membrane protein
MSLSIVLLALLFMTAGVAHWVAPASFIRIVPSFLPGAAMLVFISGVAEFAGGAGLLLVSTRRYAGWGLIALLIAVFPANIEMLRDAIARHAPTWWQAALWLRLPLQPALIYWVWRATIR